LVGLTGVLFACFIFFCGLTHLVMPLSLYNERVRLVLLDICCSISIITAIAATFVFPMLLKITDKLELTQGGSLRQAQSQLVDVIECCQESIAVMSQDWFILTANQSTRNFFGDDYMKVSFLSLVHDEDKDILLAGFESVISMELARGQYANAPAPSPAPSSKKGEKKLVSPMDDVELGGITESKTDISSNSNIESNSVDFSLRSQVCVEYRVRGRQGKWMWIESTLMVSGNRDVLNECGGPLYSVDGPVPCTAGGSKSQFNLMMMSRNVHDKKREELLRQEEERASLKETENMAKLKYITCCAHDLKTPLQSFNFAVDLLEASGLQQDQLDILHQARVSSLLLSMTISQTMDTSKVLMGGRLNPRKATIQLSEIVSRVAIVIESYSRQVPICFYLESGINNDVVMDEEWLWQMLLNYLTNACKYTESGAIDVQVRRWSRLAESDKANYLKVANDTASEFNDFLLFQIIDSGIGISGQHVATLFNVFGQAQVGQATGTGMGLYGVRIRAESLGGHCGVLNRESYDGKQGSVFWFMIPYVADTSCNPTVADADAYAECGTSTDRGVVHLAYPNHYLAPGKLFQRIDTSGDMLRLLLRSEGAVERSTTLNSIDRMIPFAKVSKKKLDLPLLPNTEEIEFPFTAFVVDDVQMIRKLMHRTLKQLGFVRIELFENGSKALTAMKKEQVDIVFMDVQMPVMSGPEVSSDK
jgi:signal transduction histidine kinase